MHSTTDPRHASAARRVVAIQTQLTAPVPMLAGARERLLSEQRTIWEAVFPGLSFEQVAETAH